jgi:hypothetical protein
MAPRKQNNPRSLEELYERDKAPNSRMKQRIAQLIDRRMDAVVERLTERLEQLIDSQGRGVNR